MGLTAASCFFGAAFYLMSVFNQIKFSEPKNAGVVADLDSNE